MRNMDLIISTITEGIPADQAAKVSAILGKLDLFLFIGNTEKIESAIDDVWALVDLFRKSDAETYWVKDDCNPDYYRNKSRTNRELQEMMIEELTGMDAFDVGCIIKYLYRYPNKGGVSDLNKVATYLLLIRERQIEMVESPGFIDKLYAGAE